MSETNNGDAVLHTASMLTCLIPVIPRSTDEIPEEDAASTASSIQCIHNVSELEKQYYYFNIRGDGRLGPRLLYRSSKETFTPPAGPENHARPIRLLQVDDHAQLGKDNLWATVRDKIGELLDKRLIPFASIDLVRFGWDDSDADGGVSKVISAVTIWVGVQENTTTSDVAYESTEDILGFLEQRGILDVDVAFRESNVKLLTGPQLLAPVDDDNYLKNVIHSVTTALGLPIAGEKTPESEGTMGFYFRMGDGLYGVTARHVLLPLGHANYEFNYPPSPKTNVILMGTKAFGDLVESIQAEVRSLVHSAVYLRNIIQPFSGQPPHLASKLAATEELEKTKTKIRTLEDFLATVLKDWSDSAKRVIGHVVWAPPLTGNTPPHGYTLDVCVIKLEKGKFWENFVENVIDLGVNIDIGNFMSMMNGRVDGVDKVDFMYPMDRRLLKLQGILTAEQPTIKDSDGTPVRLVIKNGHKTGTTIGRMSRFESKTRLYGLTGIFESIESPVLPYGENKHFAAFSGVGDSGSIVAGSKGEFVSLLTGGAGTSDSVDITYTTPMDWLWNDVILNKFPGANLYFEQS